MTSEKLGNLLGHALVYAIAVFCGYAAAYFVTSTANPLDWTPAARLVFMGMSIYVYPKLFNDD